MDEATRQRIFELSDAGQTAPEIAAQLRLAQGTIYKLLRRRRRVSSATAEAIRS